MRPGKSSILKNIWKLKKLETVIVKFFKMSQKNMGPILEILHKKFSNGEKKLENFILYGKIFKIILEKLTKNMEFQYNLLKNMNKFMEFQ